MEHFEQKCTKSLLIFSEPRTTENICAPNAIELCYKVMIGTE